MQSLSQRVEVMAAQEPSPYPVISLYLSLSTNQNGREDYQRFVRNVFSERAWALPEQSPQRESFDKDVKRLHDTLSAFQLGQVDELIITGSPDTLKTVQELPEDAAPGDVQVITSNGAGHEGQLKRSAELITRAQHTAAHIRFIEDVSLLADVGGVGALLRFRI